MKVFYASHGGVWMNGYSVIVAKDRRQARRMLVKRMKDEKSFYVLPHKSTELVPDLTFELTEIDATKPGLHLIWNGDY